MAKSSSNQVVAMQVDFGKSYVVKPRTMVIDKEDLVVQVESLVAFVALTTHGVDITSYMLAQELDGYFGMLYGPTYKELVKDF